MSARSTPHLGLLIPDGPGVRNLELTRFPEACRQAGVRVTAFTVSCTAPAAPPGSGISDEEDSAWRVLPLPAERPSRAATFWRFAAYYSHLRLADTVSMRRIYRRPIEGPVLNRTMRRLARRVGALNATVEGVRRLDGRYQRAVTRSHDMSNWLETLRSDPPDYLLASHQRPPSVTAPVLAAHELGIRTGSLIFSWDNLTSKGRVVAPFRSYLVWSELMRDELRRYYPEVGPDAVQVVGAPQFDPYDDPRRLVPREEFLTSLGADPERPVICYSGGDKGTCPEDPQHLELLLQLIRQGRIGRDGRQPLVIVRPAPVDDSDRWQTVLERFPEAIWSTPRWIRSGSDWRQILPTDDDVTLLANLTQHCDLNVNMASTMSLDFAIHDRPVVNVGMDMNDPPVYGAPLRNVYYRFDHYRRVIECGAVRVAYSADELCEHVNAYLHDPTLDREGRLELVDLQVGQPVGTAGPAIVDACLHFARLAP